MVVFFGEAGPGAIADRKRMKLTMKSIHQGSCEQQRWSRWRRTQGDVDVLVPRMGS
jgi:hypothetical protein